MKYILLLIMCWCTVALSAQTNLKLQNGTIIKVTGDVDMVLKNTNFTNNGTFNANNGTVHITGNGTTAQSQINGSSTTTFYNLTINKSNNNADLGQNATISNQLTFSAGKLEIGNYDLTMGNTATFSGQNKDRYIMTNGTGNLIRQVGNSWTAFPVGNSTFNPARLKNDGTVDNFSVRVRDNFLQNGTTGNAVTSNVIPRTWLIEEEIAGGSDVSMRLIWRPLHHNNNGFNTNAAHISHFTGGNWDDQTSGTSTADNSYSSDHRYREATNITSFSPFGVKSGAALPVELLYFYGEKEENNVKLSWQTATEINNSHFEIEWSNDGINFEKIGEVAGAGTTNDVQFYDFLDNPNLRGLQDLLGLNYYRLKQVDFDGKFEYSDILSVNYELRIRNYKFKVFPNPATDYMVIDGMSTGEIVQIFNVNSQLVKEFKIQSNKHQITINELPSGVYFMKMGKQVHKIIITQF